MHQGLAVQAARGLHHDDGAGRHDERDEPPEQPPALSLERVAGVGPGRTHLTPILAWLCFGHPQDVGSTRRKTMTRKD